MALFLKLTNVMRIILIPIQQIYVFFIHSLDELMFVEIVYKSFVLII